TRDLCVLWLPARTRVAKRGVSAVPRGSFHYCYTLSDPLSRPRGNLGGGGAPAAGLTSRVPLLRAWLRQLHCRGLVGALGLDAPSTSEFDRQGHSIAHRPRKFPSRAH